MKMFSMNVRGLGKKAKRKEIRSMLIKYNIDMCCIQETKIENLEEKVCKSLWRDQHFDWAGQESTARSGVYEFVVVPLAESFLT
ncbi:hypothetical protein ACS0TY_024444 [Phlomoides rotata]